MKNRVKKLLCVLVTSFIIIGMSPIGVFADTEYWSQSVRFDDDVLLDEGTVLESDSNGFYYYYRTKDILYLRLKRYGKFNSDGKELIFAPTIYVKLRGYSPTEIAINSDITIGSLTYEVVSGEPNTISIINDGGSESNKLKIVGGIICKNNEGSDATVIIEANVEAETLQMEGSEGAETSQELIVKNAGSLTVNTNASAGSVTVEDGGVLSINGDLTLSEALEVKEGGTLKTTGAIKVVSTDDKDPEDMIKLPDGYLSDGYSVQKVEDGNGNYYYAIAKDGDLTVDENGNLGGTSTDVDIKPPVEPIPEPEPEEKPDYMMTTVLLYMLQNSHKISFETNGGDKLVPQMKLDGTEIDTSDYVTEREGYTFAGWYFDEELTEPADVFSLISDVTLWAAWEAEPHEPEPNEDSGL